MGVVETFIAFTREGGIDSTMKRELQGFCFPSFVACVLLTRNRVELCVQVEEIPSSRENPNTLTILTRLLGLTVSLAAATVLRGGPILILLSGFSFSLSLVLHKLTFIVDVGESDLRGALSYIRRSRLFSDVILLHSSGASEALKNSASQALDWCVFLAPLSPHSFCVPTDLTSSSAPFSGSVPRDPPPKSTQVARKLRSFFPLFRTHFFRV